MCHTIRGTILRGGIAADGDASIFLKVDTFQVPGKDIIKFEIVCAGKPSKLYQQRLCAGYKSPFPIPKKGEYVEVSGVHVLDGYHFIHDSRKYYEIHPVSSLTFL